MWLTVCTVAPWPDSHSIVCSWFKSMICYEFIWWLWRRVIRWRRIMNGNRVIIDPCIVWMYRPYQMQLLWMKTTGVSVDGTWREWRYNRKKWWQLIATASNKYYINILIYNSNQICWISLEKYMSYLYSKWLPPIYIRNIANMSWRKTVSNQSIN